MVSLVAWMGKDRWAGGRALLGCVALFLGAVLWLGCPAANPCQTDTDCPGKRCTAGVCVDGEPGESGTETVVVPDGSEAVTPPDQRTSPESSLPEPPAFDASWSEGRLDPPEALQEGQRPGGPGRRKAGETCHPGLTALPQDRCEDGFLCAAPNLGPAGICQKVCKPDAPACDAGQTCGPIRSIETAALLGHACGPGRSEGYSCTDGLPCEKGLSCVRYTLPYGGVCQKTCAKREDCGTGWCASVKGLEGELTACLRLIDKAGESCANDATCGNDLTCEGSGNERVCLTQNCTEQAPCPTGNTCVPILDEKGQTRYTACFPTVPRYGLCHTANRCDKDLLCATFSGTSSIKACVTDCTSDEKVCATDEACVSVSSSKKGCVKVIPEGGLCEGPAQCAKDLTCTSTQTGGARFCLRDCTMDASLCQTPMTCIPLTVQQRSVCAESCDPKAPVCANTAFACLDQAGAGACLPSGPPTPGLVKVGAACLSSAAADPSLRCEAGLTCLALAEGFRCLQLCDPAGATCATGQQCLLDHQTQRHLCGTAEATGQPCDATAAKLCQSGFQCAHRGFSSQGTCIPLANRQRGEWCIEAALPCQRDLVCTGDPTVPFRWLCRTPCTPNDPKQACATQESCISLVSGHACFDTCTKPTDPCTQPILSCQSLQGVNVCM